MDKIQQVLDEYGGLLCRQCINEIFSANLKTEDCIYNGPDLMICKRCGQGKHIVWSLRGSGKRKLTFKKMRSDWTGSKPVREEAV